MKKDMTSGPEWAVILSFSLPIMGANLLQVLYNFADSVIVGNFIGPAALGAVGLTNSMTWLLVAFCSADPARISRRPSSSAPERIRRSRKPSPPPTSWPRP